MQFAISQTRVSFRRTYTVLVDGHMALEATATAFRLLPRIDVRDMNAQMLMSIQRRLSFFRAEYDLDIARRKVYRFRTQSLWCSVYTLETECRELTIYGHRGRKHSIYDRQRQVAYFEKGIVTMRNASTYTGLADDNEDAVLLASIVIALDDHWSCNPDDEATFSFDFGSIGPQAKPFDPAWRPTTLSRTELQKRPRTQ